MNSSSGGRSSISVNYVEQPSSGRSISAGRPSQSSNSVEQPLSARSVTTGRSSLLTNSIEQPPSARSTSAARPLLGVKPVPLVPSSVPISLRPTFSNIPSDVPIDNRRDKRYIEILNLYAFLVKNHVIITDSLSSSSLTYFLMKKQNIFFVLLRGKN